MPRVKGAFSVQKRSKKNKSYILTINYPESGLAPEICSNWQRKSFKYLPPELSFFHSPTSKIAAENRAKALIELLKKEVSKGTIWRHFDAISIGTWLVRFISLDDNPCAERLISKGLPYQPGTLEVYRDYYNRYIKEDSFLLSDLNTIDVPMSFNEYQEDHQEWRNPFDRIDSPKRVKGKRRDVLQEDEILKLFMPGVITDPLERAVAVAMFWAGLRRSEIFGL